MKKQVAGLEKLQRLGQVRIQVTRQDIAAHAAQIRRLEARLKIIPIEIEQIEDDAQKKEREKLISLLGSTLLPLDLFKLRLIRAEADGYKSNLAREASAIANQLETLMEAIQLLSQRLAHLLKRDHQTAAVCTKLAGRLRFADSLKEERSIAERL